MPPNAHRLAAPSDGPATLAASHPSAAPEPAEPAAPETAETAPSRPRDRAERRRGRLAWAIVAAALPTLMTALDSLVMTFALPDIRGDLDATVTQLQWFVNAYTLVLATLILPAAALGNLLGRRRVFLWGVALFTLASAGAALSSTSGALIAARVVQGAGGAAITTLSLTHLADAVPTRLRELAIGIWGGVNGLGVAAGPIIGGAVVKDLDWSFIFWINVPIGVVCVALGLRFLGESPRRPRSMDAPGILLGAGFVFPFTWALVEGPQRGWGDRLTIGCFGVSAASLILFLLHEGGAVHAAQALPRSPVRPGQRGDGPLLRRGLRNRLLHQPVSADRPGVRDPGVGGARHAVDHAADGRGSRRRRPLAPLRHPRRPRRRHGPADARARLLRLRRP